MHFLPIASRHTQLRYLLGATLVVCLLFSSACFRGKPTTTTHKIDGAQKQELAYGISIDMPKGWTVVNSSTPTNPSPEEIDKQIAEGKRILLFDMKRDDANNATNARVFVYLANSERDCLPENTTATATQEYFDKLSNTIMETDKELAARNNRESQMLSWNVSRRQIDGRLALFQSGLGKRAGGEMRVLNVDIYLPKSTAVVVKLMGHPEEKGTEELLEAIIESITIANK